MNRLRPLSAHEVRDVMIRDYSRNYLRLSGRAPDLNEIERLVISDLLTTDALERARIPTTKKVENKKRDTSKVDGQLAELGAKRVSSPIKTTSLVDLPANMVSARWPYAMARIQRILQPRDSVKSALRGGPQGLIRSASYPVLAEQFFMEFLSYTNRSIPRLSWGDATVKQNPYFGMNDRDASRRFIRAVEDVCDRSTGVLGNWWVK